MAGYDFGWDDDYGMDPGSWPGAEGLPDSTLGSNQWAGDPSLFTGLAHGGQGGQQTGILDYLNKLQAKGATNPQAPGQPGGKAADLSSVLGAFSSGEKANRLMQGQFTQGYDKLMLDAQGARNTNESDALKKLAQTSYITGGGSKFTPPTLSLNGRSYSPQNLGYGPPPVTDPEKAGAATLQSQLQARLSPGGSYTPQPLDSYAKPGTAENIGSYGGSILGGLGALQNAFGGGGDTSGVGGAGILGGISKGAGTIGSALGIGSKLGLLGGAAPGASTATAAGAGAGLASGGASALGTAAKLAGPVAGGAAAAYGLAKNQSVGSDVLAGAGGGASIGSFAGPIGSAVGAGIGSIVGLIRGLTSVTGKELGGREAQANITGNLAANATPQQAQEGAGAGWPDPKQATALIVMRDALVKSGLPGDQAEAKAEQAMHTMWDAEKSGADAVTSGFKPFQSQLGSLAQAQPSIGLPGQPPKPGALVTDAFSKGALG